MPRGQRFPPGGLWHCWLPACPDVTYVVYQSREMKKAGGQMAAPSATHVGPEVRVVELIGL